MLCFLLLVSLFQAVCYGQYVTEIDDCIRNGVNVTEGSVFSQDTFNRSKCGFLMQANQYIVVQPILVNISMDARIRLFLISGNGSSWSKTLIHEYYSRFLFRNLIFVAEGYQRFALVVLRTNASSPVGNFTFLYRTRCYVEMVAEDFPRFNSPNYYPRNPALLNELARNYEWSHFCSYKIFSRTRKPFSVKFNDITSYYGYNMYIGNRSVYSRTTYTFDGQSDVYINYTYYNFYTNSYGFNGSVEISFELTLMPIEYSNGIMKGIPQLQTLGQNYSFQYGSLSVMDAQIMCNNLGFGGLDSIFKYKNSTETNLLFHQFQCTGPEKRLSQCAPITKASVYYRNYQYRKARPTGISCTENFQIRLVNRTSNSSGNVQVKVAGNWGYICAHNMDQFAGDVLCRELGFRGASNVLSNYTNYYYETVMSNLRCESHSRLKDCYFQTSITYTDFYANYYRYYSYSNEYGTYSINPYNYYNYYYYYYSPYCSNIVSLTCRENTSYSLSPGHYKGYLMVNDSFVCNNSYTERNAAVYCRALGYPGVWRTSYYGSINSNNYTTVNLRCSGSESSPLFCPADLNVNCPNNRLAGVICQNVALAGGTSSDEGRVEVFYNGRRGLLCDDNFDIYDGNVICRQLGFLSAVSAYQVAGSSFGYGNGVFLLNNLYCGGYEESINQCSSSQWGQYSCGGNEIAGLVCYGNGTRPLCEARNVTSENFLSNNGSVTYFGANPWQVRLIPTYANEWCSATIINRNWIITSANCFASSASNFYVATMSSYYSWDSYYWTSTNQIQSLFIHPSYSAVTGDYNIALVKVTPMIAFNNSVHSVCLPSSNFTFNGTRCKTTGWIHRSTSYYRPLMGKPIEIKSSDYCMSHTQFDNSRMSRYLCSDNNMEPSAAFNGESGGPLVCSTDGQNTLVGVVARSINGARATSIRLFSRVDYYLEWINRTISQN